MKKIAPPARTSWHSKATGTALSAVVATLLLTGCPASKLPDVPPTVPQPKLVVHLFQHSFEI